MSLHLCPCCDYATLEERGVYDICPVCFWEDDGQDVDALDRVSGPNHITLREGRRHFLSCGACDPSMLKHVCSVAARRQFAHHPREVEG
ncbi:MAG: CPCC family cysteine-rich protein [Planctomycetota bacterium]